MFPTPMISVIMPVYNTREYLVFAERMISIHKKPINMGNLLSPKSISGKIDAGFFDSGRQLSCI